MSTIHPPPVALTGPGGSFPLSPTPAAKDVSLDSGIPVSHVILGHLPDGRPVTLATSDPGYLEELESSIRGGAGPDAAVDAGPHAPPVRGSGMTAPDRAAAMQGLRDLLAAMEADPSIPAPAPTWPLTFHAPPGVDTAAALAGFAASLGVTGTWREYEEEGSAWWAEVQGYAGGIPVRVTADTSVRVEERAA